MRTLNNWIKQVEEYLEEIKALNPTDRLSLISSIIKCANAIGGSIQGWYAWLADARIMETFKEEELRDLFKVFQELAQRILETDIEWSKKKVKKPKYYNYVR